MSPEWILRTGMVLAIALLGWALFQLVNNLMLKNAVHKALRLPDFRQGTAAIIYFTTPDCIACKTMQRPALARLQQMAGDRLQVIEINAYENPKLAKDWGILSVPTTFILDPKGTPRQVNHGVTPLEKLVEQLRHI